MLKLIRQRFISLLPLLLAVALGSFLLVRLAPGDFLTEMSLNPQVSAETLARLREQYALDQPWYAQFGKWLAGIVRGDFGYSFAYSCPASGLVYERLLNTALLATTGLVLTLSLALPLGLLAANQRGKAIDRALVFLSALSLSTPSFLLALLAVVFAARSGWFPIGGVRSLDSEQLSATGRLADFAHHLILPATVLAIRQFPGFFRQLRAELLEILTQDYVLAARAKGLPERTIFIKHAFRNAINPLITMLGNSIGSLLSGAFIVEAIMSWPGLGSLTVSSLLSRDLFVLVACLIFAALLLALGNLLADVLLALADPRIRQTKQL
ncbi:MAG: ABC transporter permease [Acidobacteriota bacterium]|nr:ABC transporter permease [Acidobacteriota bacterium]